MGSAYVTQEVSEEFKRQREWEKDKKNELRERKVKALERIADSLEVLDYSHYDGHINVSVKR